MLPYLLRDYVANGKPYELKKCRSCARVGLRLYFRKIYPIYSRDYLFLYTAVLEQRLLGLGGKANANKHRRLVDVVVLIAFD